MQKDTATYTIGDLHGEVSLLRRLLMLLPFREEDTLVFLGDCLDRGEDSVATILALQDLKNSHQACVFLRGNHEDAWLNVWNGANFSHAPDIEGLSRFGSDVMDNFHLRLEIGWKLPALNMRISMHTMCMQGYFQENPSGEHQISTKCGERKGLLKVHMIGENLLFLVIGICLNHFCNSTRLGLIQALSAAES